MNILNLPKFRRLAAKQPQPVDVSGEWIQQAESIPAWLNQAQFPLLREVLAGPQCPVRDNGDSAHAHALHPKTALGKRRPESSIWYGTICIRHRPAFQQMMQSETPTPLFLHEYAHLIAGHRVGHGPKWQRAYGRLLTRYGHPILGGPYGYGYPVYVDQPGNTTTGPAAESPAKS